MARGRDLLPHGNATGLRQDGEGIWYNSETEFRHEIDIHA